MTKSFPTKIVNFIGGPGAGKSTLAGELFGWMKRERINCEYAPEFAKDLTWRRAELSLQDQFYIYGEQHHRLYSLLHQVEYVITDSPLILSLYYMDGAFKKFEKIEEKAAVFDSMLRSFHDVIKHTFEMYDNEVFFVNRKGRKFVQAGRNQTEEESKKIDKRLIDILDNNHISYNLIDNLDHVLEVLGFI